jgi:hypothetical protein
MGGECITHVKYGNARNILVGKPEGLRSRHEDNDDKTQLWCSIGFIWPMI